MDTQKVEEPVVSKKANILLIASDEQLSFYLRTLQPMGYDITTIFDEWGENQQLQQDDRAKGHCGPLCNGFVEALIEKDNTAKYDVVVIDLLCEDLIAPLKHAGYSGPLVVIGNQDRETDIPYVPFGPRF